MSASDNKAVSRRFFEEVCTQGRLELIDELVTSDVVHRDRDARAYHGPDGVRDWIGGYRAAFPDMWVTVEVQVAERDRVVTRWTTRGSHEGELAGTPPTGRSFAVTGVTVDRFVDGRIAESVESWDALGMLQQLGLADRGLRTE